MKVAIVIEGHTGIGLSTAKLILQHRSDIFVYLTGPDEEQGVSAVEYLKHEGLVNVKFQKLDVDDLISLKTIKSYLVANYPRGIDVLVMNIGGFPETMPDGIFDHTAIVKTLNSNYSLTYQCFKELSPLLIHDAKVVFVSSRLGHIAYMKSSPLVQQRFDSCTNVEELTKIIEDFKQADPTEYESGNWMVESALSEALPEYQLGDVYAFGLAKLAVTMLAKMFQDEYTKKNYRIRINICCPGMIHNGTKIRANNDTARCDQLADSVYYLTDFPFEVDLSGAFVAERNTIDHCLLSDSELEFFKSLATLDNTFD